MPADRAQLQRLHRLERVRAIAKRDAAAQAAQAEAELAQLQALAERTEGLMADYGARDDARDGAQLRQFGQFRTCLQELARTTRAEAERATAEADRRMRHLAEAERRRQAVEDRAEAASRTMAAKAQMPLLGQRRGFGTGFE